MINYHKEVCTIPEEGVFWKVDVEDTFAESMKELVELGMSKEDALDFLDTLYYAVGSCYGD